MISADAHHHERTEPGLTLEALMLNAEQKERFLRHGAQDTGLLEEAASREEVNGGGQY